MRQRGVMRGLVLATSTFALLLVVAACGSENLSAPAGGEGGVTPVSLPMSNATSTCRYTPAGDISIGINKKQFFTPNNAADCAGAFGVLTAGFPADSLALGFIAAPCTLHQAQESGTGSFCLVLRCAAGPGSLRIYTNSAN